MLLEPLAQHREVRINRASKNKQQPTSIAVGPDLQAARLHRRHGRTPSSLRLALDLQAARLGGWLHAKIFLVLVMSGVHGYYSMAVRAFAEDRNRRSQRHWRFMNEVPTLLMVAIVILVVVKPF